MNRDKFLTEAMGECWHNMRYKVGIRPTWTCEYCGHRPDNATTFDRTNFSTWEGFGKLWEWAQEQKWFEDFLNVMDVGEWIEGGDIVTFDIQKEFINPDMYANVIYKYLKP